MFSKQHYTTPSLTKVLGSNGCDALRRFQGQHCMTFPGEVVPLYFSFCLLRVSLFFGGNFFSLKFFCICIFSFFLFGLSRSFLFGSCHLGQGFSSPHPQWHIAIQLLVLFPKGRWEHCMMNISKVAHNGWICLQFLILNWEILTHYATFYKFSNLYLELTLPLKPKP